MFSLRAATSVTRSRFLLAPQQRPAVCELTSRWFSSDEDYAVGSVKFYLRGKSYGFIIPDDPSKVNGASQLWVHRTSFDTPHSSSEFPTRPYLLKDERVKFRVDSSPEKAGDTDKAIDVLFENGRRVPLFRKNYHSSVVKGEMQRLGEAVYPIMQNSSLTDEERMEQVKAATAAASETIALAASRQEQYGPEAAFSEK